MKLRNNNFRDDINGLRAWAVVAVILYHFGVVGFTGGFVGVDVFFVISGFLMTRIIVKGIEGNSTAGSPKIFSILNFYSSRASRIVPALLVLCCFLILAGYFFLSETEYNSLSIEVLSALGFFSNILFWLSGGYFDSGSHEKPLLHTWSLSVEWQFYLILPVVILTVWKLRPGRSTLMIVMVLGFLSSLLLSIMVTPVMPNAAFYLLPARAWEMLAGGLVFLLAKDSHLSDQKKLWIEGCGFGLIIFSIAIFDAADIWPGWRAILPVFGTILVLIAARQHSIWTGSRAAQWLGNCSYSLYLWHWPFAVALAYLQQPESFGAISACLVLTLLFGWISYRFVETPARTKLTRLPQMRSFAVLLVAISFVAIPSFFINAYDGISGRFTSEVNSIFAEAKNKNPRIGECHVGDTKKVPECTYGGKNLGVIVLGDSHAGSFVRSIEKSIPDKSLHVLDWSLSSCQTVFGLKDKTNEKFRCKEFVDYALRKQQALASRAPIILINRYTVLFEGPNEPGPANLTPSPVKYVSAPYQSYNEELMMEMRSGVINTACEFAKTRAVYMMRPIPELKYNVPKGMARSLLIGDDHRRLSVTIEDYNKRNAFLLETQDMAARQCGIKLLDPLPYLCSEGVCWGDKDGLPLFYDDDHMNERGASLLIPMFREVFRENTAGR
ncbi:acyltransferase [Pseudomonas gregormendelii]|uniref:Acyltransferase n=1 Tax=Pseudomonas gregormendelii TaxID=1628277 RepID=A0ABS3AKR6_9PSED|nr:acyltransferase family protein [Pseudomonas gregormendelii]MBN3966985.1 acyltransferase [Pseudomonas gregormendelii]